MRDSRLVSRARLLSIFFIALALLLVVRLYFIQVVHARDYQKRAMGQYVETSAATEDRNDIFFTTKNDAPFAAAVMKSGWRIALVPGDIVDAEATYAALSAETPIDRKRFDSSIAKTDDPYEEVAQRVSDEAGARIRAHKIPGVLLVPDEWRYYPAGPLAAHTLGFVGYRGDKKEGVYGLERSWQSTLAHETSGMYVNPFAEIFTNVRAALSSDPASEQGSLITSLDPEVQRNLEAILGEVVETYSPRITGGIVMDPKTGEIVAMGVRPGFDLNSYNTVDEASVFSNPLVESIYEMGSIMKPLTVAAGLDSGAITQKTTYDDKGCIEKSGKKICNFDKKARGVVPMQEILNQSLNLGVSFIVDKMGQSTFREYIQAYGLGEHTKIDLPNEAAGIIRTLDGGYDVDYASASFGQGIAVTGVEMIRALAALANGGVLPAPHIVTGIKLDTGIVREIQVPIGRRVLKEESALQTTDMLVEVFDTALLKGKLKQEHYSIAAKTGTAQIAAPGGHGYYSDRYLHSFFGYFPAYQPRFIVLLVAVEPHGAEFASATLARPFLEIAKFLINYYEIPPDR